MRKIFLSVIALLLVCCAPGFAQDVINPARLGILFTSDNFDIPDNLSQLVTNIIGSVVSSTTDMEIVKPEVLEPAGYNAGLNKSEFYDVKNAASIGSAANADYILLTSMNFDLDRAAKTYAVRGIAKMLGRKPSIKNIKPTFDSKLIESATGSVVYESKEDIDAFKDDMKQKIVAGMMTKMGLVELDTSAVAAFAAEIAPEIQRVIALAQTVSNDEIITAANVPEVTVTPTVTPAKTVTPVFPKAPTVRAAETSNSILLNQPAYHNLNFHAYKPSGLPSEYYVTYDGYLVYKADNGVWQYASNNSRGITKTNYVVGSVIPSVVRLIPYDKSRASVAPVMASPISERSNNGRYSKPVTRITYSSASSNTTAVYMPPTHSPVILSQALPEWAANAKFMAIAKWQKSIDRIGILDRPRIPVAWKGDFPEVIYAWTGSQWRQLSSRGRDLPALSTIRRESYGLIKHVQKTNLLRWNENDSNILSQYANTWGYKWLGTITTGREY